MIENVQETIWVGITASVKAVLHRLIDLALEQEATERVGAGLGHQVLLLAAGEPLGAVDGLAEPPRGPRLRIGTQVDPELPGVAAPQAHRARSHVRRL